MKVIEWEYVRIINRNYLQVRCQRQNSEESFSSRMLMSEPIKGLLPCKTREVNGVLYLLYDISSMQNLSSLYAEKKMDFEDVFLFVFLFRNVIKEMKSYLLEAESLMLFPEFIFQEIDTKKFSFLCYPYLAGGIDNGCKKLWDFLISVIDHEDEKLVELVYKFYEKSEDKASYIWLDDIYRELEEMQKKRVYIRADVIEESNNGKNEKSTENLWMDREEDKLQLFLLEEQKDEKKKKEYLTLCYKILLFSIIYACCVGIGVYYLYSNYILTLQENIICLGILTLVTGGFAFGIFHKLKEQNLFGGKEYEDKGIQRSVLKEDVGERQGEIKEDTSKKDGRLTYIEENSENNLYGKTVYFEAEEIENKLYGIGKKNHKTIELNKFPFVIGKKEEMVDAILDDASVSRVHARFIQENSRIILEDLNSTNGSFKNGIMLVPHEQVEVLPEDEIRFGKLQFIYR